MEFFSRGYLDSLDRFSQIAWGNSRALLRQLPGAAPDVQFLDLGEYLEPFQVLFNGLLDHHGLGRILVRNEYRAAVEALETDPAYETGAYVSGEPGIGKTIFLFYALVHFLGKRQPVALHQLGGSAFYVLFRETATIHHLDDDEPLSECGFVWALSDSNAHIRYPPATFTAKPGRIRVIQSTPPEASRWRQWSEQWGASGYIMAIWTEKEIENFAILLELDVERVVSLSGRWGPIPRSLLMRLREQNSDARMLYRACSVAAICNYERIMHEGRSLDAFITSPFYFIRPMRLDTGDICRLLPDMLITPTHELLGLLAESLQGQGNTTVLRFYRFLTRSPETRPAADFIFETWFRNLIATGNRMPCQWVSRSLDGHTARLPILLPKTIAVAPATGSALTTQTPPYRWHVPYAKFPGIHSVLVLEKEIFAFQLNLDAEYVSPNEGLEEMQRCLPADLKDFGWRVVFVGAEGARIARVAQRWASASYFSEREGVRVGWLGLDEV